MSSLKQGRASSWDGGQQILPMLPSRRGLWREGNENLCESLSIAAVINSRVRIVFYPCYTVNQTEQVIITQFGGPSASHY